MFRVHVAQTGNICCGHKMFLTKIRNIVFVSDANFVSETNVARASKRGNICVRNIVSLFDNSLTFFFFTSHAFHFILY